MSDVSLFSPVCVYLLVPEFCGEEDKEKLYLYVILESFQSLCSKFRVGGRGREQRAPVSKDLSHRHLALRKFRFSSDEEAYHFFFNFVPVAEKN